MGLDGTDLTPPDDGDDDAPAGEPAGTPPVIAAPATTTLPPDSVRNSPEYLALMEQNRTLARQAGSDRAAAAQARQDAEAARLAAEAQQRDAVAQEIRGILGEDGEAVWREVAELSSTDPVAAARRLAEFRGSAQSAPGADPDADVDPQQTGEPAVPAQGTGAPSTPPPMGSSLHADSPLGSVAQTDSDDAAIAALDKRFNDLAERAQHPLSQNRLTEKERQEGIMAHFAKGVVTKLKANRQGTS